MKTLRTLPALALLSLLAACGGGGGGGQQPDVGSTPTNQNAAQTPAAPNTAANTSGTASTTQNSPSTNTPNTTPNTATKPTTVSKPSSVYIAPKIAEPDREYTDSVFKETVNGHTVHSDKTTDISKIFPLGYSESTYFSEETFAPTHPMYQGAFPAKYKTEQETGTVKVHHLPHSIMIGSQLIKLFHDNKEVDPKTQYSSLYAFEAGSAFGELTKPEIVNKMSGSFQYKGVAFNGSGQGLLNYHVDFSKKTGSGQITGLKEHGNITLHQAAISNTIDPRELHGNETKVLAGIEGKVSGSNLGSNPTYHLGFFGPKAEEIAGYIETQVKKNTGNIEYEYGIRPIGFSGSRQ